jgi:hypothetical protein
MEILLLQDEFQTVKQHSPAIVNAVGRIAQSAGWNKLASSAGAPTVTTEPANHQQKHE